MKKYFVSLAVCSVFSSFTYADDYHFDVVGLLGKADTDVGSDGTLLGAGIQYHFQAVDTSKGPLAEAAFINKSTNVSALQLHTDADDENFDVTVLGTEIYIPNTMFYVGFDYSIYDDNVNDDSWSIDAGVTPIEGLLVTTSFYEDVDYEANAAAKYLLPLSNGSAVVLRANFELSDDFGDTVGAGADYYFNKYTGVGFNVTDYDGENETELHVTHFFIDDAYAGLSWTNNDVADVFAVTGGFRF